MQDSITWPPLHIYPIGHGTTLPYPGGQYVPAPQSMHRADPVDVLYVPAVHAVHSPPSGPEEPALQVQLVKAELPPGELEFVGQVMHVEIAVTAVEYVPVPQSVHDASAACPEVTPYLPALQAVHDDSVDPPVPTRYLPAMQAVHDASAVCPAATPYLPAPQAVQSSLSAADLYFPAMHDVHDPLYASPP